ncbi:uncharacterized protein LOC135689181 [Rhopilema esculentum]|uniref:uncharacterized protein LOC135689181 n=1 Tax=Rhopilema esculentum TaxID=499914 RepID=UPI0031D6107E
MLKSDKKEKEASNQSSIARKNQSSTAGAADSDGQTKTMLLKSGVLKFSKLKICHLAIPNLCSIGVKNQLHVRLNFFSQKTKTRKLDKLVSAEALDGGKLREAAKRKNDQKILIHIEDKDCVALEFKNHRCCFSIYTSFLRHETATPYQNILQYGSRLYAKSFDLLCEKFIRPKIIEKEKTITWQQSNTHSTPYQNILQYGSRLERKNYYMAAIKEKFVQTVKQVEGCDASSYWIFRLKERLIEMFLQLIFDTPKKRNKSEIVYVEDISKSSVAETYLEKTEITMTESDDNSEEESGFEVLNPGFVLRVQA